MEDVAVLKARLAACERELAEVERVDESEGKGHRDERDERIGLEEGHWTRGATGGQRMGRIGS